LNLPLIGKLLMATSSKSLFGAMPALPADMIAIGFVISISFAGWWREESFDIRMGGVSF
jgi:hypothetical protein